MSPTSLNVLADSAVKNDHDDAGAGINEVLKVIDFESCKKIGRNDPCPCGSGQKYKHCCGRG